jgi:hypothetical protein
LLFSCYQPRSPSCCSFINRAAQPSNQTSHFKINIKLFGCFVKIVKCRSVSTGRIGPPKVKQNNVASGDCLVISLNQVWYCSSLNLINGAASTKQYLCFFTNVPIPPLVLLQLHFFFFFVCMQDIIMSCRQIQKPIELDVFVCCRQIPHDLYAEPHQRLKFGCDIYCRQIPLNHSSYCCQHCKTLTWMSIMLTNQSWQNFNFVVSVCELGSFA